MIDLSDERGLFCGHVLAQLGADVVHVEASGAAPSRSVTWLAYGRGSRSVTLDLDRPGGRDRLLELVSTADILIESADPGTWEAQGLGFEQLSAANPALVWVSMTPFGSHGPKASYAATDLIVQAASGALDLSGPAERAPLRTAAITAWTHAAAEAAGGALIALFEARRSGRGQRVEVSAQRATNLAAFFQQQNGRIGHKRLRRAGGGFTLVGVRFPFVWPVADGFVSLTLALDPGNRPFMQRLMAYMAEEGAIEPELAERDWTAELRAVRHGGADNTQLRRLVDVIGAFLAERSKAELVAAALDRRLLLVPLATIDDLLTSPQLAARGYWRQEELAGTAVQMPAHLVRASNGATPLGDGVPAPGQHTAELLGELEARRAGSAAAPAPTAPAIPSGTAATKGALDGLRVLDFMWVMAGPTSTGVLAQYGATVVRLENAARIDTVRLLAPYYDGKAGRETSMAFASINAGKLSVTIDPNVAESREVIHDLVRWADVVTESFSPRAMRAWGFDYESLRRVKPDLVMLSSCLFGQDGPMSGMAGYGTMGSAMGGIVQPTGWPDQEPAGPYGAYTDVCAPRITVAALLAALEHRRQTGEGTYIDQSQIEASLQYLLPAVIDRQLNGTSWDRMANRDAELCPHGVFRCAGDDRWVAIAVRDDADWVQLCGALGRDDLAGWDVVERRAHEEEIEALLGEWSIAQTPEDVERMLQERGVPAHAVLDTDHGDAQLDHLHHTVVVPHTGQPDRLIERTRIELTRTPPDPHHVPALGEHTEQVLRDVLGYDNTRIAALAACGALGGQPNLS